jgi:hypothetical protein
MKSKKQQRRIKEKYLSYFKGSEPFESMGLNLDEYEVKTIGKFRHVYEDKNGVIRHQEWD